LALRQRLCVSFLHARHVTFFILLADFLTRGALCTLRFFALSRNMTAIYEPMTTSSFLDAFSSAILQMSQQISAAVELMELWELGVYELSCAFIPLFGRSNPFFVRLEGGSRNFVQMKVHLLPMPSFCQILSHWRGNTVLSLRSQKHSHAKSGPVRTSLVACSDMPGK
jgi:hypothetical protein